MAPTSLPQPATAPWVEELFDRVPDIVFFVKDVEGRYLVVNHTLVQRCGAAHKSDLVGRTAAEVFPPPLGERYLRQDREVCRTGRPLCDRLELHLFPSRLEGWCLTDKIPVRGAGGQISGLAGLSRDLRLPVDDQPELGDVAASLAHLQEHPGEALRVEDLAARVGLSPYQLNRRVRAIFGLTTGQLITKTRIDAASARLRDSDEAIAAVAQACGYCDQSAFARQFKSTVGLTPRQYRLRHRPEARRRRG